MGCPTLAALGSLGCQLWDTGITGVSNHTSTGVTGVPALAVLGSVMVSGCTGITGVLYWGYWGPSPICTGVTGVPRLLQHHLPITSHWAALPSNSHSCPPAPVPTLPSSLLLLLPPRPGSAQPRGCPGPCCPRRAPRSCGSGCGRCARPPASTGTRCPPATPAPSAPAAGPAACSPPVPVGLGVPRGWGARAGGVGVAVSPLLWLAAPGCSRTHGTVLLAEWSDLGDPAVAAQSLYGHLR